MAQHSFQPRTMDCPALRRHRLRAVAAWTLLLVGLSACPSEAPFRLPFQQQGGTFSVVFSWNGVTPPGADDGLYVLGELRQRAGDGAATTVRTAGPVLYAPGNTHLDFGGIEPGNGYGVVVEFRPGTSREIPVRYYGISQDFDLHPNDRRTVEVRVGMRGAPGVVDPRVFRVADVAADGVLRVTSVDLILGGPAGEHVRLSNNAVLPGEPDGQGCGASRTQPTCQLVLGGAGTLEEPSTDGGPTLWRVTGWSLDTGLDADAGGACARCTRRVYARFQDDEGYASETYTAEVALDTEPPAVELENWQPGAFVGGGRTLVLALRSTTETVRWEGGVVLRHADGGVSMVDGPRFLSYAQWLLTVGEDTPEGPLWVDLSGLRVTDTADNAAALPDAGVIRVDRTAPKVLPGTLGNAFVVAPQAGVVHLAFDVAVDNGSGVAPLGAVALASDGGACVLQDGDAGVYGCTWDAPHAADAGDRTLTLQVEAADQAGNRGAAAVSVRVDGTPPSPTFATVFYVPDPQNPLSEVTHARQGTTVRAIVVPSEPVRVDGLSVAFPTAGPAGFTLALEGTETTDAGTPGKLLSFLSLRATLEGAVPDGDYPLQVQWADEVGNQATLTAPQGGLPFLRVLGSRPSLVVDQNRLLLRRSPTGGDVVANAVLPGPEPGGDRTPPVLPARAGPREELLGIDEEGGEPGPLDLDLLQGDGGRVLRRIRVFEWPADGPFASDGGAPVGREVANVPFDADAGILALQPSEGRGVVMTVVDSAGNESLPLPVQRMELRLQPRAPLSGDPAHRVFDSSIIHPAPWVLPGQFNADLERHAHPALATMDGADGGIPDGGALVLSPVPAWERAAFSDVPRLLTEGVGTVVQDTVRNRLVHLGTAVGARSGGTSVLWEFDGDSWVQPPLGSRPSSVRPAAAYDPLWGVTWAFSVMPGPLVGAWDGVRWTDATPTGLAFPGQQDREFLGAVYDPFRARAVVLLGSTTGPAAPAQAYAWDGTTLEQLPDPEDVSSSAVLVWDGQSNQVLLLDTCRATPTVQALGSTRWEPVQLLNGNLMASACRVSAAARVFNGALDVLVQDRGPMANGGWALARASPMLPLIASASTLSFPVQDGVVVHDVHRARFLQVGRRSTVQPSLSVHALAANSKTMELGRGPFPAGVGNAFCVVPAVGSLGTPLVLTADTGADGTGAGGNARALTVWGWSGGAWRRANPTAPADPMPTTGFACSPTGTALGNGAFADTVAVVYGGHAAGAPVTGRIFRLEVTSGAFKWASSAVTGDPALVRQDAAMALDAASTPQRVVLFGGTDGQAPNNDLLELRPTGPGTAMQWVALSSMGAPAARSGHTLVATGVAGELLVLGTNPVLANDHVYRLSALGTPGARWTHLTTSMADVTPLAAVRHEGRGTVVVVGFGESRGDGVPSGKVLGELRPGTTDAAYTALSAVGAAAPGLAARGPLLVDPVTHDVVLALPATDALNGETWLLRDPPGRSAALHALFNLGAAHLPARHLVRMRAVMRAAGTGTMWVWRGAGGLSQPGAWEHAVTYSNDDDVRGELLDDPGTATLTDADGTPWVALQLRTAPMGNNVQSARPRFTVDSVEVRARFCTTPNGEPCP